MAKRYWYVLVTYIIMQFSGLLFAPLLYTVLPISVFQATVYWSIFSFIVGLIIVLLLMRPDMELGSEQNAANFGGIVLWSIAGFFMASFGQSFAIIIETNIFGIKMGSENTQMIMNVSREAPLFIIITALIAPILEEIIFRKIIFGTLYIRTNFFIAAAISALIFALIHGEPQHVLIYGTIGFVFAFLYVKTKRIIVPIITHIAMNTVTVIAQYNLTPEDIERMQKEFEQLQMILIGG